MKLVCGVGVNDADYDISISERIGSKVKIHWLCPFYRAWVNMLYRCYSEKSYHTYKGCSTVPEWHYFMTFRKWMIEQDWEGKQLDKDILVPGNKIYGPDTCVFVTSRVNSFITESTSRRGEWPIGVDFRKDRGKYQARCWSVVTGKYKHLGFHPTAEEAHQAWLTFKLEQAKILASEQNDPRVAKALVERYENYAS